VVKVSEMEKSKKSRYEQRFGRATWEERSFECKVKLKDGEI
jgi:hypothetical protein